MRPFPPIDRLEIVETHPLITLAVLRDGLILVKFRLPSGRTAWRHHAGHRPPFDDRQARLGEPRRPTHDDGHEHQSRNRQQPQPDGAAAGFGTRSKTGHAIVWLPAAARTI